MAPRKHKYLAVTATQARQLEQALQHARRAQRGDGLHSGRGMMEQQDVPEALYRVKIFVRKYQSQPGYYTTLGDMAGAGKGSVLDRFSGAALGVSGALTGLAGLSAATGVGLPAAVAEGTLAAGLAGVGGLAAGADRIVDALG